MLECFYCYHIIIVYYNLLKVTNSNIRNLLFCLIFLTHIFTVSRNALQKNQDKSIISCYAMAIFTIVIIVFDTNYRMIREVKQAQIRLSLLIGFRGLSIKIVFLE